jgi:predicted  nucleic acid-binding Zn-ribbon protein
MVCAIWTLAWSRATRDLGRCLICTYKTTVSRASPKPAGAPITQGLAGGHSIKPHASESARLPHQTTGRFVVPNNLNLHATKAEGYNLQLGGRIAFLDRQGVEVKKKETDSPIEKVGDQEEQPKYEILVLQDEREELARRIRDDKEEPSTVAEEIRRRKAHFGVEIVTVQSGMNELAHRIKAEDERLDVPGIQRRKEQLEHGIAALYGEEEVLAQDVKALEDQRKKLACDVTALDEQKERLDRIVMTLKVEIEELDGRVKHLEDLKEQQHRIDVEEKLDPEQDTDYDEYNIPSLTPIAFRRVLNLDSLDGGSENLLSGSGRVWTWLVESCTTDNESCPLATDIYCRWGGRSMMIAPYNFQSMWEDGMPMEEREGFRHFTTDLALAHPPQPEPAYSYPLFRLAEEAIAKRTDVCIIADGCDPSKSGMLFANDASSVVWYLNFCLSSHRIVTLAIDAVLVHGNTTSPIDDPPSYLTFDRICRAEAPSDTGTYPGRVQFILETQETLGGFLSFLSWIDTKQSTARAAHTSSNITLVCTVVVSLGEGTPSHVYLVDLPPRQIACASEPMQSKSDWLALEHMLATYHAGLPTNPVEGSMVRPKSPCMGQ